MSLDLETAPKPAPAVEPPVQAPPEPVADQAMTAEGVKPDVADPALEQAAPQQQSASDQAFEADTGVHYWDEYKAELEARGKGSQWDDKFMAGHTDAAQWVQPYEGRYAFEWSLKKGQSASEALQSWLKGLTVAEYRSVGVAVEVDEVRQQLGDRKFDELFGSKNDGEDAKVPVTQRLKITASAYTTPIDDQMKEIAAKHDAKQLEKTADATDGWEYFDTESKGDDKAAKADELVAPKKPIADEAIAQKQ